MFIFEICSNLHLLLRKLQASKRPQTVAMSSMTREGTADLMTAMEAALSSQMEVISCTISYHDVTLLSTVHNLGILDEVQYLDEGVFVRGKVPLFLKEQIENRSLYDDEVDMDEDADDEDSKRRVSGEEWTDDEKIMSEDDDFDWSGMAKGRHSARRVWEETERDSIYRSTSSDSKVMDPVEGVIGHRGFFDTFGGLKPEESNIRVGSESGSVEGQKNIVSSQRVRSVKRSKCTTDINKRKALEADGDEFNDTSKLLDFDAGDYYGASIVEKKVKEERTSDGDER